MGEMKFYLSDKAIQNGFEAGNKAEDILTRLNHNTDYKIEAVFNNPDKNDQHYISAYSPLTNSLVFFRDELKKENLIV